MKLAAAVMMVVVSAGSAQGKSDFGRQVTVYFNDRADVPFDAQGEAKVVARGMFASIGITIHWRAGSPSEWEKGVIVIEMATATPSTRLPGSPADRRRFADPIIVAYELSAARRLAEEMIRSMPPGDATLAYMGTDPDLQALRGNLGR